MELMPNAGRVGTVVKRPREYHNPVGVDLTRPSISPRPKNHNKTTQLRCGQHIHVGIPFRREYLYSTTLELCVNRNALVPLIRPPLVLIGEHVEPQTRVWRLERCLTDSHPTGRIVKLVE